MNKNVNKAPVQKWRALDEEAFSKFVSDFYARPYQLQQQGDLPRDTIIHLTAAPDPGLVTIDSNTPCAKAKTSFQNWLAADATASVEAPMGMSEPGNREWLETGGIGEGWVEPGGFWHDMHWHRYFYPPLEDVISDLCRRGALAAGEYRVHVCW